MNILRSPGKRHWVKCMLGLDELGIAILPHIKAVFQEYYDENFWEYHHLGCTLDCQHNHYTHIRVDCWSAPSLHSYKLGCQCWQCCPEKFAEERLSGRYRNCVDWYDDRGRNRDCNCREYFNKLVEGHEKMHGENFWYQVKKIHGRSVLKTRPDCTACQSAFELLKQLHVKPDSERTHWINFKFPGDFGDSWQLAKAFMPSGNTNIDDPTKVDPVALLTVINNCKLFKDVDTSFIDTIIKMRNSLVHIGSQKDSIDEEQTDKFFSLIIKFLGSFKELNLCQEKIATIEKIKASEVTAEMFTKANANQIQSLLNTLNDAIADGKDISKIVADFECALKDKVEAESVDKFLEKEQKLRKLLNDTKLELAEQQHINSNQKKTICAINAMIDNLQANISKIEEENSYLKNELARKERINSDQEKMIDARNIQIDTLRTEKSKIEQENSDLEKECINLCNYLVIICIASSIILGMLLY